MKTEADTGCNPIDLAYLTRRILLIAVLQTALQTKNGESHKQSDTISNRDPTGAAGNDVGSEIDIKCKVKLPYKLGLELGAAHFFAGDFVKNLMGSDATDSNWAYVQLKRSF